MAGLLISFGVEHDDSVLGREHLVSEFSSLLGTTLTGLLEMMLGSWKL